MDDYKYDFHPTAIPQWERLSDTEWVRDWEIRFAAPVPPSRQEALSELSEPDIHVIVSLAPDRRSLKIRTTTAANPYSDEIFIWAAFRMLKRIDENVQRIDLIQGQPRAWWHPFRDRKGGR
jgi:hypothetical protein